MNRHLSPPGERFKAGSSHRQLAIVFVTAISLLTILYYTTTSNFFIRIPSLSAEEPASEPSTWSHSNGQIRPITAPRSNFWGDLTQEEANDVVAVVESRKEEAGLDLDAKVTFLERLLPNKSDVISALSINSHVERWSRVVILQEKRWGTHLGGISEWMVGPLPNGPDTTMMPLNYIYNANRNYIKRPIPDIVAVMDWMDGIVNGPLKDMITDLLGRSIDFEALADSQGLMAFSHPTTVVNNSAISSWMTLNVFEDGYLPDSWSLTPQGLYAHLEINGFDEAQWEINGWYYDGILYNSTAAFHQEWKAGKVQKTLPNRGGHWTESEPEAQGIAGRDEPSPLTIQPYGPRAQIDEKENYVSWMGWEFYLAFSGVTSLSLFDIRFREERIMYELAFQEALAHYAGSSPALAGQAFFDTLFGFGINAYELIQGYDCPAYATYLPIKWYRGGKFYERKNAICVFEALSDQLLSRHTTRNKVTASKNSYLVVRTVSTVGNYDYTVSYHFYLDGSIEVKVHASGYIFTDYLALDDMRKHLATSGETQITEYGYRVHDVVISSMHTHDLLFKADLDIAGTENTLYQVEVEPTTREYSFEENARHTMHLVHTPVTSETGLDWKKNSEGIYVVLNNASENTWGEKRGYKIVPGTGMGTPPHLAMKESTAVGKAAAWAFHNLWVLKQHDEELKGASEWNGWETNAPLVDFSKMVNDENTVQDDLVIYFNLGVHHLSNSQDIPNTLMNWAGTSVMFIPHNYFDRDPSRDSAQGVRLKMLKDQKGNNATYFGPKYEKDIHVSKEDVEPDLSQYDTPEGGIAAISHPQRDRP